MFGWSLARFTLPAWYGVGSALHSVKKDEALMKEMNAKWPFFSVFMSNIEMAFTKANMNIAEAYSQLCDDEPLRNTDYDSGHRRIRTDQFRSKLAA